MPPTRPLAQPMRPVVAPAKQPIPGAPGAPSAGTPAGNDFDKLQAEVNQLKKDFDTKLSNEVGKLSGKFQKFATRISDEQKGQKTQLKAITKSLSGITKMNTSIVKEIGKLSGQ